MSLRRRLLNLNLRVMEKPALAKAEDPGALRANLEKKARILFRPPRGSTFEQTSLGGISTVKARGAGAGPDGAILYFHGGGYIFGSPATHQAMAARLSRDAGVPVWLPDYRLAPEAPFPAAVEDAEASYRALIDIQDPAKIALGGDSAGGGLTLALLLRILAKRLPLPGAVFAFSPLTDLTFSGESFRGNEHADVMLPATRAREMAQFYLGDADPKVPEASPLFGDFAGAPPVCLMVGDTEILLDDTRRLANVLRAQQVEVAQWISADMPHAWPLFQGLTLPEANQTLSQLARWLTPRTGWSAGS